MPSVRSSLAALAVLLSAGAASAADMTAFPEPQAVAPVEEPQLVEFGTGWYLRGDVGYGRDKRPSYSLDGVALDNTQMKKSASLGLGIGYKFTSWLRSDVTLDYRLPYKTYGDTQIAPANCAGTTFGCTESYRGNLNRLTLMANGYIDLGTWSGVTPYVGAGAGVVRLRNNGIVRFTNNDTGALYAADTEYPTDTRTRFAWSLMGGVAVGIAPHTTLDIGYRYLNYGGFNNATATIPPGFVLSSEKTYSHEIRVGIRYTPDI